jgi:hypothetical protein
MRQNIACWLWMPCVTLTLSQASSKPSYRAISLTGIPSDIRAAPECHLRNLVSFQTAMDVIQVRLKFFEKNV